MNMQRFFILFALCFLPLNAAQNRVVLITGASRGVGLATAQHLAENGFTVYGTIRNKPPTDGTIHFLPVDLTDETSIQSAIATILEKEGHIDVLINNAGYAIVGPVESLTNQEIHDQMEVNFYAPIRLIQAVLPSMRKQQRGHIINISSINAIYTPPFGSLYAASKAALESFSESLCVEVKPYNIAVSIVEPGLLSTQFSILMGTKEIPDNPYQNTIDAIKTSLEERMAHPEHLSPSQSADEIAAFLLAVIDDPHPKLRYQTSEAAKNEVSKKLLDLTGELYVQEMEQYFGN